MPRSNRTRRAAVVETMGGHGIITITGEMTTNANLNIQEIARRIVGDKYGIQVNIVRQSPEIGAGVGSGRCRRSGHHGWLCLQRQRINDPAGAPSRQESL